MTTWETHDETVNERISKHTMENLPKAIYLHPDFENNETDDFNKLDHEHTYWSENAQDSRDPKYILDVSAWIDVKDRLPEPKKLVLVYTPNSPAFDIMSTDYIRINKSGECLWDIYARDEVTHWMPLPEPPKSNV